MGVALILVGLGLIAISIFILRWGGCSVGLSVNQPEEVVFTEEEYPELHALLMEAEKESGERLPGQSVEVRG